VDGSLWLGTYQVAILLQTAVKLAIIHWYMEIDFVVASLMLAFGFLLLTLRILVKTQFVMGTLLNGT
jgi:hypothetical protein